METANLLPSLKVEALHHRGEARIGLHFPYDKDLIANVKELPDARRSASLKCWHVPDTDEIKQKLFSLDLRIKFNYLSCYCDSATNKLAVKIRQTSNKF